MGHSWPAEGTGCTALLSLVSPDIPIQVEDVYIAGYPVCQYVAWDGITINTAIRMHINEYHLSIYTLIILISRETETDTSYFRYC